jgi:AraC-like DNA-binding protein
MGITYTRYLNDLRLSKIRKDLIDTDLPVKDILEKHGFTNYKLFRRMFNDTFGCTPGQYRKKGVKGDGSL